MPRIPIDDLDDPRIAVYRNIKATNQTRHSGQFVLEGVKLLKALLASSYPLVSALVTDRNEAAIAAWLPPDVPLYVVPQDRIDALVGFDFHQGVISSARRGPAPRLDGLVPREGTPWTAVVCPRLDNPENLGSLVRIADVFGVAAVVVGGRCPDPLSRRVLRVSMGAALRMPVIATEQLEADWHRLHEEWGVHFAAAVTDREAVSLDRFDRPTRLALVLGSESAGLAPEWAARCEHRITIPMRPGADSLNVAVAAGILLYHLGADGASLS